MGRPGPSCRKVWRRITDRLFQDVSKAAVSSAVTQVLQGIARESPRAPLLVPSGPAGSSVNKRARLNASKVTGSCQKWEHVEEQRLFELIRSPLCHSAGLPDNCLRDVEHLLPRSIPACRKKINAAVAHLFKTLVDDIVPSICSDAIQSFNHDLGPSASPRKWPEPSEAATLGDNSKSKVSKSQKKRKTVTAAAATTTKKAKSGSGTKADHIILAWTLAEEKQLLDAIAKVSTNSG